MSTCVHNLKKNGVVVNSQTFSCQHYRQKKQRKMLFTSPQLQREFVKSHFKGSARKVRTDLDFGENGIIIIL